HGGCLHAHEPVPQGHPSAPFPPPNPPGPPAPPAANALPPWPRTEILPSILTSSVARMITGGFVTQGKNGLPNNRSHSYFTVAPAGILTEVYLNPLFGGNIRVVSEVGLNAPSAPVDPLEKA